MDTRGLFRHSVSQSLHLPWTPWRECSASPSSPACWCPSSPPCPCSTSPPWSTSPVTGEHRDFIWDISLSKILLLISSQRAFRRRGPLPPGLRDLRTASRSKMRRRRARRGERTPARALLGVLLGMVPGSAGGGGVPADLGGRQERGGNR